MVDGMIDAATVIDAQINYGIPSLKSTLKLRLQTLLVKVRSSIGAGLIVNNILLLGQLIHNSLILNLIKQ
jgi:hypothetical protein